MLKGIAIVLQVFGRNFWLDEKLRDHQNVYSSKTDKRVHPLGTMKTPW